MTSQAQSGRTPPGGTFVGTHVTGGWEPIGDSGLVYADNNPNDPNSSRRHFIAVVEGNNYIISNLYINRSSADYVGLFGDVRAGAKIRRISAEGGNVTVGTTVGVLVGINRSTITDCYATG